MYKKDVALQRLYGKDIEEASMSLIETRLLEMQIKGDRLDEINAEETLNRLAAGRKRRAQLGKMLRHLFANWIPTMRTEQQAQESTQSPLVLHG
jgi:hypothetical protein